ncbi:PEP-CTERM sorting domain-containing protein [Sphaerotilus sp.]|uniref:PEP-CTERM sorting domain-containing protein n=1 Tax=Sphaerotilus sp. TaxID=2093942 RepID=UPI0034E29189
MCKPKTTYSESDKSPSTIDDGKSNKVQESCMLKKFVSILALAGLASGQAFAVTNLGFETGTTGWTSSAGGSVTQIADGVAPMVVYNDYATTPPGDITTPYNIAAQTGGFFGLLDGQYNGPVTFAFNAGVDVTNAGDTIWLRMFSAEYDFSAAAGGKYGLNDDFARVTYSGAYGNVTDTLYASDGAYLDSGWKSFAIPVGTTGISIALVDVNACNSNPTCGGFNAPKLGVDFTAAVSPVPEPEMNLMMLAGLGVIGGVARRRMKKAA